MVIVAGSILLNRTPIGEGQPDPSLADGDVPRPRCERDRALGFAARQADLRDGVAVDRLGEPYRGAGTPRKDRADERERHETRDYRVAANQAHGGGTLARLGGSELAEPDRGRLPRNKPEDADRLREAFQVQGALVEHPNAVHFAGQMDDALASKIIPGPACPHSRAARLSAPPR